MAFFGLNFPPWVWYIGIYILLSALGLIILSVILVVMIVMTPGGKFLRAKMSRQPIIPIITPAGLTFEVAKAAESGVAETKGLGFHVLEPGTGIREKKSGVMLFFSNYDFSHTMPLDFPQMLKQCEALGLTFRNSKEFLQQVALPEFKDKLVKYMGRSIKISDLARMWPFNISPAMTENKTQYKVMEKTKSLHVNPQTWIFIGFGLIAIAIAIGIIYRMTQGQGANCSMSISPETLAAMCKTTAANVQQAAANAGTVGLTG